MNKLKTIFLIFLITQASFATIRYVSKTGNSTPPYTSWETASDSIKKCINICAPGDTVIVANGIYKEVLLINKALTFLGSSMDSCVIDGTGLDSLSLFTIEIKANCTVNGFKIIAPGFIASRKSIMIRSPVTAEVSNCKLLVGVLESSINTNLTARNLIIKDYPGAGIFAYGEYLRVENCLILRYNTNNLSNVGILTDSKNAWITNNILISEKPGNNLPYGDGIRLELVKKAYIHNNIIANYWNNIDVWIYPEDSCEISNNLSCYIGFTEGTFPGIRINNGTKITNNILYKLNTGISGNVPGGYNLFWGNKRDTLNGYKINETDIFADPMFVKDTMPTSSLGFDFHLQAFSPAIDAGDPTVLDVDGTRSDIGPYGGPYGEEYTYQDLAPRIPYGIVPIINEREVTIKWIKNSEADTSHYVIYRDTVSTFPIDSLHIFRTQKDTMFQDTIAEGINKVCYRIQCVDKQGNKGDASDVISFVLSEIGEYQTDGSYDYHLYQNYPNPFNPRTVISYQQKTAGRVKIMIYDIKGELMTTLLNEHRDAGYHEIEFNGSGYASGIYLCRIEIIDEEGIPRFMDMKKMVLIK